MKIEGGEERERERESLAKRFIIERGAEVGLQKSGKFAGDVTVRERKGKVRVIDKVSNVTLKYRSGEREKGLAAMVVVRRACRVPDLFSRSVSSRLIYHSATRSAGTCMHAHACALMHESALAA